MRTRRGHLEVTSDCLMDVSYQPYQITKNDLILNSTPENRL